jgi:hypothetical protein
MSLDPTSASALQALILGFAFAGLLASAFELVTRTRASFSLLERGGVVAVASLPMLVFCAPFIILRNTVRGRRFERRPIPFVMIATCIAGFWSLVAGRVLLNGIGLVMGA